MQTKSTHDAKISRLLSAYGIPEKRGAPAALARKLQTTPSAVSGWRSRGVPDEVLAKASRAANVSFRWLDTGEGNMLPGHSQVSEQQEGYASSEVDKELFIEVIEFLEEVEAAIGRKPTPRKKAELAWLIYKRYAAGEKMEKADVIELFRLAS